MILTEKDKIVLTPTYHIFNMYKVHGGAILMPASLITEKYNFGNDALPAISQTVSRDTSGKIHISLSNINPNKEVKLTVEFNGKSFSKVNNASILTAPAINSVNTFDKPGTVKPGTFKGYTIPGSNRIEVTLPGKSVVMLELE